MAVPERLHFIGSHVRDADAVRDDSEAVAVQARVQTVVSSGARRADHHVRLAPRDGQTSLEKAEAVAGEVVGPSAEGEIMDGDRQRSAALGRDGEGAGVHDVHAAGHALHCRSAQVLPRGIQQRTGERDMAHVPWDVPRRGWSVSVPGGYADDADVTSAPESAQRFQDRYGGASWHGMPGLLDRHGDRGHHRQADTS